jgi:hypothetical protein
MVLILLGILKKFVALSQSLQYQKVSIEHYYYFALLKGMEAIENWFIYAHKELGNCLHDF